MKINVEYNFDNLEASYDQKLPICIDKDGENDIIALSLAEAEHVVIELTKMIREIKLRRIEQIKDDVINEFS